MDLRQIDGEQTVKKTDFTEFYIVIYIFMRVTRQLKRK